jgi:hypothetical protein
MNKSHKDSKIKEFKNEEGEIINPTDILNTFNQYFTDLGEQLSNDIPYTNTTPESYFTAFDYPNSPLFCFKEISELETLRLLQKVPRRHRVLIKFQLNS